MSDEQRRQLRFALFLQTFAALMMGIAFVVRASAFGFDGVTALLAIALVAILAAAVYTLTRLRKS